MKQLKSFMELMKMMQGLQKLNALAIALSFNFVSFAKTSLQRKQTME
jgi:hypothetical protein